MKQKGKSFVIVDALYILGMILPILAAMACKVLYTGASEGISISGATIYWTVPLPLGGLPITESQVNSWAVVIAVTFLCLFMTHGLSVRNPSKRQHLAELAVQKVEGLVKVNMGDYFEGFPPFICAVMALSGFSSLMSLFGLFAPTSDMNVVAGWAILVFILITYYKMKCGPWHYCKSFADPLPMLPMNIIGEIATPVSMAFRHYGNVMSGSVVGVLVASGLTGASRLVLGWIPGAVGQFPLFRIGIPAILSIYFDIFSGCLQAFIFAMLTMLYVAGAFPAEDYLAKRERRKQKQMQN